MRGSGVTTREPATPIPEPAKLNLQGPLSRLWLVTFRNQPEPMVIERDVFTPNLAWAVFSNGEEYGQKREIVAFPADRVRSVEEITGQPRDIEGNTDLIYEEKPNG